VRSRGDYSMLVTGFQASFYKKADTTTIFTCSDGKNIIHTFNKLDIGESTTLETQALGKNVDGEIVCEMKVTWSIKRKK
jgi:hypothetical protein